MFITYRAIVEGQLACDLPQDLFLLASFRKVAPDSEYGLSGRTEKRAVSLSMRDILIGADLDLPQYRCTVEMGPPVSR